MQAPDFWQAEKGGFQALALSPIGRLYGLATKIKLATIRPWKAPVPILCVGNLIAGGAGKTPVAIDLGQRLQAKGKVVHFLSRGYGGQEKGPLLVDVNNHDYHRVGDEPLLLAAHAPTWISADRRAGCSAAANNGAEIIIMDDGFQNPSIAKDFSIIVVDGGYGFGNGHLIPAGPLRETLADGFARAQAAVVVGEDRSRALEAISACGLNPLKARLVADTPPQWDVERPVVAFAGIGRPEKFFETVASLGCPVSATYSFPDHHAYSEDNLNHLETAAQTNKARLLTTEKDAKRLPDEFLKDVGVVSIRLEWTDETALDALLNGIGNV